MFKKILYEIYNKIGNGNKIYISFLKKKKLFFIMGRETGLETVALHTPLSKPALDTMSRFDRKLFSFGYTVYWPR